MTTLTNGTLSIGVAAHGAELQSINKDGKEYLWQGNPEFWGRRSPVLFPIVGRVWNDTFRVDGIEYRLGQHGFARDMDFELIEQSESRVTYLLESDATTEALFPFGFRLQISYEIEGNTVVVKWDVTNTGRCPLPFQIGAHPAFNLPDFDATAEPRAYVRLCGKETLRYVSLGEKGCVAPGMHILKLGEDSLMPIERHTFDGDAYIFQDGQLSRIDLLSRDKAPYISMEFDTPLVALWAPTATKPNCPFICIEPWFGRADAMGYTGEFADREHILKLAPGETFKTSYRIIVQ